MVADAKEVLNAVFPELASDPQFTKNIVFAEALAKAKARLNMGEAKATVGSGIDVNDPSQQLQEFMQKHSDGGNFLKKMAGNDALANEFRRLKSEVDRASYGSVY